MKQIECQAWFWWVLGVAVVQELKIMYRCRWVFHQGKHFYVPNRFYWKRLHTAWSLAGNRPVRRKHLAGGDRGGDFRKDHSLILSLIFTPVICVLHELSIPRRAPITVTTWKAICWFEEEEKWHGESWKYSHNSRLWWRWIIQALGALGKFRVTLSNLGLILQSH